jgi:hypothetical protein
VSLHSKGAKLVDRPTSFSGFKKKTAVRLMSTAKNATPQKNCYDHYFSINAFPRLSIDAIGSLGKGSGGKPAKTACFLGPRRGGQSAENMLEIVDSVGDAINQLLLRRSLR